MNLTWIIELEETDRIALKFLDWDIEKPMDYIELHDGDNYARTFWLKGFNYNYLSKSNIVKINFISFEGYKNEGFKIIYKAEDVQGDYFLRL